MSKFDAHCSPVLLYPQGNDFHNFKSKLREDASTQRRWGEGGKIAQMPIWFNRKIQFQIINITSP